MAVGILDGAILAVGNQFRTLVDTHSPASFHSLFLGLVMTTAALCVFTFHIPTTIGIGDDMLFFLAIVSFPLTFVKRMLQ